MNGTWAIMTDENKPDWLDEVREHPMLIIPLAVAVVAGAIGLWAQIDQMMPEPRAWSITTRALAVVVVMLLTAWILKHFRLLGMMGRWRERRGFEVKRKDDEE